MSKEEKEYVELALKTMMNYPEQLKKNLIQEFLDDLHGHRGKYELELVHYLVGLEEKWENKLKGDKQ